MRSFLEAQGVSFHDRARFCNVDATCDGSCRQDDDCTDATYPSGSCPAPASCVADGICESSCGSADADCGADHCADYGHYGNGVCDPYCASPDPDCTTTPGTGAACTPTHYQLDPWTGQYTYLGACGVTCGVGLAICDGYGCHC